MLDKRRMFSLSPSLLASIYPHDDRPIVSSRIAGEILHAPIDLTSPYHRCCWVLHCLSNWFFFFDRKRQIICITTVKSKLPSSMHVQEKLEEEEAKKTLLTSEDGVSPYCVCDLSVKRE